MRRVEFYTFEDQVWYRQEDGSQHQLTDKDRDAVRFIIEQFQMSVELVAYLHDVHPNTVRKYVNCGLIEKHPTSSQTRIKIRASDALMLDFATMKKKAKTLIYDQDETQSKSNF